MAATTLRADLIDDYTSELNHARKLKSWGKIAITLENKDGVLEEVSIDDYIQYWADGLEALSSDDADLNDF